MDNDLHEKDFCFEPRQENLEDILFHTKPRNKSVCAIASYGYATAFLAAGATFVDAIDVDPKKIAWNHFLKELIRGSMYEHAFRVMQKQDRTEEVINAIPERYREEARRVLDMYSGLREEALKVAYPFLRNTETYAQVREAIREERWNIIEQELFSFLEEQGRGYDVIYTSTVRTWVLEIRHRRDRKSFDEMYDQALSAAVAKRINKEGIFYEAVPIPWELGASIMEPIREERYPFLQIQRREPLDEFSNMMLMVGKAR